MDETEAWDDEDAAFAEWERMRQEGVATLRRALARMRGARPPAVELRDRCRRLRGGSTSRKDPFPRLLRRAGIGALPDDDAELLISVLAGTISSRWEASSSIDDAADEDAREEDDLIDADGRVEDDVLDDDLQAEDWLGAVIELAREGVGASSDPESLVEAVQRCPEVSAAYGPDEAWSREGAFSRALDHWQALGVLDERARLTTLGAWALPRALARAWGGDFDAGP